jgi:hypothetical protein
MAWYTRSIMAAKGFALQSPGLGLLRDVGLPLAAISAALILPFHYLVHTFIVIGQAHFFMAYLYQYRGRRMDARYLAAAVLIGVLLIAYLMFFKEVMLLLVLISVLFSFHFAWDELALHDEGMTRGRLVTVLGFSGSFFLLTLVFAFPNLAWPSRAALGVALGAIALRFLIEQTKPARGELYIWFVQALLFGIALGFGLSGHVLALIVIIHVINWYIAYGVKLSSNPARAKTYWREVALFLLVTLGLFVAYWELEIAALGVLFALGPYYAWAVAHILLSYVLLLPRPVRAA